MAFFDNSNAQNYSEADAEALNKALAAGYGTDSSAFVNGRALIPEDCEQETLNVLEQSKDDCKVMSTIKTTKVSSTVHEKNVRTGQGDYKHLTTTEGGESIETNQEITRKTYNMKFLQTLRGITQQMVDSETFEGALASEKISGIDTLMKGCEYLCFHGNSDVVPTEFDSFETQIRKAAASEQNIKDLRGVSIGKYGVKLFDEIASDIYRKGGDARKVLFPVALSQDIKDAILGAQGVRYVVNGPNMFDFGGNALPLRHFTSVGSTLDFAGQGAGADRFYHVKGVVEAEGDASKRPDAPASVTAAAAAATGSKFAATDAGDYLYTVHAVNSAGISVGVQVAAAVAVAGGDGVTLTITPGSGNLPTGYIVCRSAKGGTSVMEMTRIAANGANAVTFTDVNEELPGTASMLFLTENKVQTMYKFGQLTPVSTLPLGRRRAMDEFLVITYGALELYAPKFQGLVKNIAYTGGLY